jgi:NADH:ubiquinone oxidoreductase subunit F (NADH-binding)
MSDTVMMERPSATTPRGLPRLLAPGGADLPGHLRVHGPLPYLAGLIEEVEAAGLTGRGGAAFPTAVKLAAAARQRGDKVVVGNGAEGEPASNKDKQLLWLAPHLVLDGLQLAAHATGASRACLYLHRHEQLNRQLAAALDERAATGWDRLAVDLVTAPPRFLAGEESALVSRVGGGLARPTFKRQPIFERGIGGAPTLVLNVETLAHLAVIARHGAVWFRATGTAAEPGSMLVTAHRADEVSRVTEVPVGASLAAVLDLDRAPAQAVLTGGYHGAWITADQAARVPLTRAALRPLGATVGAGVLAALPPDRCGLAETARVLHYLAAESAGQCGPCLNGLPRIAATFAALADPRLHRPGHQAPATPDHRATPDHQADLERWAGLVTGRGACHHPDGTVRLVRSALTVFAAEIAHHQRGHCTANQAVPPFLPVPRAAARLTRRDWR